MKQLNQFMISGRLGHDAELKPVGDSIKARFSIAINKFFRRKNKEITCWINIEAWRKKDNTSEFNILKKGNNIAVIGYFEPDEYSKNGASISVLLFHATQWKYISEDELFQPTKWLE